MNIDDLIEAWESTIPGSNNGDQTEQQIREETINAHESEEEIFVRELIDHGFINLVPRAIQKFPNFDLSEGKQSRNSYFDLSFKRFDYLNM